MLEIATTYRGTMASVSAYCGIVVITSIVNVVPIATPKTVLLTLDTLGIPRSFIPAKDAIKHPNSEPNRKGSGVSKRSRRRLNARHIRIVLSCKNCVETKV